MTAPLELARPQRPTHADRERPGVICCRWLVTDIDRTLDELRTVAERDAIDALLDIQMQPAGEPVWSVIAPATEDGETFLTMTLPVEPWLDPVRDRTRRATTPKGSRP